MCSQTGAAQVGTATGNVAEQTDPKPRLLLRTFPLAGICTETFYSGPRISNLVASIGAPCVQKEEILHN